ncbi:MAG TPA: extracellular solute-binding protein [Dongiaceae bacterium]|jgi:putative spermidine/putrescine transport system substrate-binding protein|nr:extracellular solute-binding protein [Dongiaceae bacterium]
MPEISRRSFLTAAGAAALLNAYPREARAAAKELTIATWGGNEIKDLTSAFAKPFTNESGIRVLFDGAGPSEGKIKAMVDQSQVDWDLCDVDGYVAVRLANAGVLSIIDYKKVKRDQVMVPFALEHAIAGYTYSFVLAYNATAFPDRPPLSWKDFFDRRTFPGKRAVWRWMIGGFEAAAMAAGATRDKLYPLDIEAAVAKLATLGDDLVVWESGDHVHQMLLDGTINMACMWHSRAAQLGAESEGKVAWTFEEGLLCPGMWVVPKKNPGGNSAFDLLAAMQQPKRQLELTRLRGLGPSNPAATAAMPENLRPIDPTQPQNLSQQAIISSTWWAENYDKSRLKFQDQLERM